ncbi:MAG: hypothetical protein ACQESC_02920 [Nanobdellota archaeon]
MTSIDKKTLKQRLAHTVGGLGLLILSSVPSLGQNNSIELVQTDSHKTSRVRPHAFYELPGCVKGYSFGEFYQDGQSYLIKSSLSRHIVGSLDAHAQLNHGSAFTDQAGIGLKYTLTASDNTVASVKLLPAYMDFTGSYVKDKVVAGFYVQQTADLPIVGELDVTALGEVNVGSLKSPQWCYGEAHVSKTIDDYTFAIGADFRGDGDFVPEPNLSVKLGYTFKE